MQYLRKGPILHTLKSSSNSFPIFASYICFSQFLFPTTSNQQIFFKVALKKKTNSGLTINMASWKGIWCSCTERTECVIITTQFTDFCDSYESTFKKMSKELSSYLKHHFLFYPNSSLNKSYVHLLFNKITKIGPINEFVSWVLVTFFFFSFFSFC